MDDRKSPFRGLTPEELVTVSGKDSHARKETFGLLFRTQLRKKRILLFLWTSQISLPPKAATFLPLNCQLLIDFEPEAIS